MKGMEIIKKGLFSKIQFMTSMGPNFETANSCNRNKSVSLCTSFVELVTTRDDAKVKTDIV